MKRFAICAGLKNLTIDVEFEESACHALVS